MLIGLTPPLHDFMRSNCYPVCLCADNMPFSYFTPLSTPLTGRRIQQRYMSFFCIFLRCISSSIYLFLLRKSSETFQSYQCLKISRRAIVVCNRLFIDQSRYPSPFLLSVLFVDKSKCVCQKLYVLLYDCVYNMAIGSVSAPMCVLTFNLHLPLFYIDQTCSLSFFSPPPFIF